MEEPKLKELPPEIKEKLEKIAIEKGVTIISFVAPLEPVRVSPATITRAVIEESEMHRLEKIVREAVEKKSSKTLHLIVHTPGGELHTSYKIASFLRSKFLKISVFVPYQAASGGTFFCCAANELYIGDLGNLTPIDPQIKYKGTWVSVYSFLRAVDKIRKDYGEMSPDEVPTPWQQMIEKIDPVIYDEMNSVLFTVFVYASKLLQKSGYEENKSYDIVRFLTRNLFTHSYQIMSDEARTIGFNVQKDEELMKIYSELVDTRLKEKYPHHCIDPFLSIPPKEEEKKPLSNT